MLPHDDRRIERDDLSVGEGGLYDAKGFPIFYRLVVDRKEDGAIDDEKVGISGGEPLTLIHHGIGHGEFQESVGLAFRGTKRLQLFFQGTEVGVLGIVLVLAPYIGEGVVGTEPHYGVDMSVGVVTDEVAVVQPYDALSPERVFEFCCYLLLIHRLVAVGRQEALCRCEHGTFAITLYRTALEHEIGMILYLVLEGTPTEEVPCDGVVLLPGKLLAPAVELEVEQMPSRQPCLSR